MPKPSVTDGLYMPAFNGIGAHALKIKNISASATLTAADSGTVFLVVGATAAVAITLPVISTGPFWFKIINCSDQDLTVSSQTADTLITFNDLTADSVAFSTSSEKIGGTVEVYCDGVSIVALTPIIAHSQTVTVATA